MSLKRWNKVPKEGSSDKGREQWHLTYTYSESGDNMICDGLDVGCEYTDYDRLFVNVWLDE